MPWAIYVLVRCSLSHLPQIMNFSSQNQKVIPALLLLGCMLLIWIVQCYIYVYVYAYGCFSLSRKSPLFCSLGFNTRKTIMIIAKRVNVRVQTAHSRPFASFYLFVCLQYLVSRWHSHSVDELKLKKKKSVVYSHVYTDDQFAHLQNHVDYETDPHRFQMRKHTEQYNK